MTYTRLCCVNLTVYFPNTNEAILICSILLWPVFPKKGHKLTLKNSFVAISRFIGLVHDKYDKCLFFSATDNVLTLNVQHKSLKVQYVPKYAAWMTRFNEILSNVSVVCTRYNPSFSARILTFLPAPFLSTVKLDIIDDQDDGLSSVCPVHSNCPNIRTFEIFINNFFTSVFIDFTCKSHTFTTLQ